MFMGVLEQQLIDFRQTLIDQKDIVKPIFDQYGINDDEINNSMQRIENVFIERLTTFQPEIMFYGIYNAGKSSLLNALMGKVCAKVADIPTTDSIDFYQWNGYRLTDTPGVNAPIEHQKVTEEHLRKSDVVIFVMSTNGGFEDSYNYRQMAEIIKSGKQLIIVLNDKVGYVLGRPEHDKKIAGIKRKIASNMMQVGISSSIEVITDKYQIILVHADRALKGRLEGSNDWVTMSNIGELEKAIVRELKRTDRFHILINVIGYFEDELRKMLTYIEKQEQHDDIKQVAKLLATVREQKLIVNNSIAGSIRGMSNGFEQQLAQKIWVNRQNQSQIDQEIQIAIAEFTKKIQEKLMKELEKTQEILQVSVTDTIKFLTDMQEQIRPSINIRGINNSGQEIDKVIAYDEVAATLTGKDISVNIQKAIFAVEAMEELLKGKNMLIMGGSSIMPMNPMDQLKKHATEVVAKKAMEIAVKAGYTQLARYIGVAVPYIGPIIFVGSLLYDLISSGNKQEQADYEKQCARNEARNEQERRRIEMEVQARQELRQNCSAMAYELVEAMMQASNEQIGSVFSNIEASLTETLESGKNKSASLAIDIKTINAVMDECRMLKMSISN